MKLVNYIKNGDINPGLVIGGDRIYDIKSIAGSGEGLHAGDPILSMLFRSNEIFPKLRRLDDKLSSGDLKSESPGEIVSLESVELAPPILRPSKIIAIGLNYMDHCVEQKVSPPPYPIMFAKFPTSVLAPGGPVSWDPDLTSQVDYEAELALVIGKRASRVKAKDAFNYIAGYTALNDISARDLQFSDGQWIRGKSLDTFCPMGPWLVTPDEIRDPQNLKIRCAVNGTLLQDSNTSEMIFKIPELIEFITRGITLNPGDVIATGTPHGVGVFREPKIFLKDGDTVEVSIESIGTLRNKVRLKP